MKRWRVNFEINLGEYSGTIRLEANELKKINAHTIIADGVSITFEEPIEDITCLS